MKHAISAIATTILLLFAVIVSAQNKVVVIPLGNSSPAETPQETIDKVKEVDGTGSGLDADLLDGQDGVYYRNWNNLTNIPAGFADGTDADTQLTEAEVDGFVSNNGYVTTESDPVFTSWNKSTGISITESQVSDLAHFTTGDETDPSVNALGKASLSCSTDQVARWNGNDWVCSADVKLDQKCIYPKLMYGVDASGNILCGNGTYILGKVVARTIGATTYYWLDRNLGASQVATSATDSAAYGDLYQWGRGPDGHESRSSSTTSVLSASDSPGHDSFINSSSFPHDWRTSQNDNLWQGVSGINNPCPSGFRLPTEIEWETERAAWVSEDGKTNDSAGAFASPLKLTVAGDRYYNSGAVQNEGSQGIYWSSTVSTTYGRHLHYHGSNAFMNSSARAFAYSVRCIKD